ncbi:MAG: hypothetical protein GY757_38895, partial [bacterium]|nr:hypothetical protein [bacterium]
EVTVTAGSGRCDGTEWEITTEIDVDLSGVLPTGEDFIYIYIDDSASSYPTPTIIGSTTEPAWSDSKIGWYNGSDRCIGVVWSPDSSATVVDFSATADLECIVDDTTLIGWAVYLGNPNGSYQTAETTAYIPVNATKVRLNASNNDSGELQILVGAYENTACHLVSDGYNSIFFSGWIELERGWSRDLKWSGQDNDNNNFCVSIIGYTIER